MANAEKLISVDELAKKLYIYDAKEVRMTGRVAKRRPPRGKSITLFEIREAHRDPSKEQPWRKWVRFNDLFVVADTSASRDVSLSEDLIDAIRRVKKQEEYDKENNNE